MLSLYHTTLVRLILDKWINRPSDATFERLLRRLIRAFLVDPTLEPLTVAHAYAILSYLLRHMASARWIGVTLDEFVLSDDDMRELWRIVNGPPRKHLWFVWERVLYDELVRCRSASFLESIQPWVNEFVIYAKVVPSLLLHTKKVDMMRVALSFAPGAYQPAIALANIIPLLRDSDIQTFWEQAYPLVPDRGNAMCILYSNISCSYPDALYEVTNSVTRLS
jgi:hypothetical protein